MKNHREKIPVYIRKQKAVHYLRRNGCYGEMMSPCKIQNKNASYLYSGQWKDVTCQRCLSKKFAFDRSK